MWLINTIMLITMLIGLVWLSYEDIKHKSVALLSVSICLTASIIERIIERIIVKMSEGNNMSIKQIVLEAAFFIGFAIMNVFVECVGFGDILCMLFVFISFGFIKMCYSLFIATIIFLIFSGVLLLMGKIRKNTRLPFIPFISAGVVGVMILI